MPVLRAQGTNPQSAEQVRKLARRAHTHIVAPEAIRFDAVVQLGSEDKTQSGLQETSTFECGGHFPEVGAVDVLVSSKERHVVR